MPAALTSADPYLFRGESVIVGPVLGSAGYRSLASVSACVAAVVLAMVVLPPSAHAAAWTVDSVPSANVPVTRPAMLSAVSCASTSMCMAVGSYLDTSGKPSQPLAEAWNGTDWSLQNTPPVSGGGLAGVSCPSVSLCLAVGSAGGSVSSGPLAEVWNGTAWSVLSGTDGPGDEGSLTAVSCSSTVSCMAVGRGLPAAGATTTSAELWNGARFASVAVPNLSSNGGASPRDGLTSVSCSADGACGALGIYTPGDQEEILTAVWNGTAWSVQHGPAPGRTYPGLNDLSCPSASACEAVGVSAERYNGTGWSAQTLPLPTGSTQESGLFGDSCPSADACVAVGVSSANSGQSAHIFADTFNGTAWAFQPIATPGGASKPELNADSCVTATACIAVGSRLDTAGDQVPLILGYDGSSWSVQATPTLSRNDTTSRLTAVSCSAPGACTAVGIDAGGVLAMRSHAGGWSVQSAPNPAYPTGPSTTMPELASVACPAFRVCLAVGSYTNSAGNPDDFAEFWNGSRWSLQAVPRENGDTATTLDAVSCPSARRCLAAGGEDDGVGEPMSTVSSAITEQWTGSSWTFQGRQPHSPAQGAGESPENVLSGVSCSSRTRCTAVGLAATGGPCGRCGNLAERFTGRGWTLERPSQAGTVQGVSCPTATRCVAVGGDTAQVWNGSRWVRTRIRGASLTAVSCPSGKRCVAAGTSTERHVLIERWNGISWSDQAAPDPAGATHISVSGVSCPTASACVLVGSYQRAGQRVSLVESST